MPHEPGEAVRQAQVSALSGPALGTHSILFPQPPHPSVCHDSVRVYTAFPQRRHLRRRTCELAAHKCLSHRGTWPVLNYCVVEQAHGVCGGAARAEASLLWSRLVFHMVAQSSRGKFLTWVAQIMGQCHREGGAQDHYRACAASEEGSHGVGVRSMQKRRG
ncbi:unspecified product [Leishmania tarentolae]|uniref:Unspecified product n=1 Tax=Leishmania tarentolae TaxID=5689 RepID=A0A640KFP7_LEITA|nr:unspecified product [Leishmania tarentolae]